MSIRIEIPESQLSELQQRLEGLEVFDRNKALNGALSAAGKPVVEKWKSLAPRPGKPGYTGPGRARRNGGKGLADALATKTVRWKTGAGATLIIGADYTVAPHEHLVELGHRKVRGGTVAKAKADRAGKFVVPSARNESRTGKGSVGGTVPGGFYGKTAVETTRSEFESALYGHIEQEIKETLGVG